MKDIGQETNDVNLPQSPALTKPKSTKKQRSRLSTLTNLLALIALFSVVFALQYISTRTGDEHETTTETKTVAQETTPQLISEAPARPSEKAEKTKPAVVDLTSLKGNEAKQATTTAKPTVKKYAPPRTTVRRTTHKRDIAEEDRRLSAKLVDDLDGNYVRRAGTSTVPSTYTPTSGDNTGYSSYDKPAHYSTTEPSQATAASYTAPEHRSYGRDLDDETARQNYLATNRAPQQTSYGSENTQSTSEYSSYSSTKRANIRTRPAYNRWEN